jgi:hypothetical protein
VLSNVVAGQGHRNPSSVSVELFDSLWVLDELVDPEVEWWLDKIRTRFQYFAKTADTYTHYHTKRYAAVNDWVIVRALENAEDAPALLWPASTPHSPQSFIFSLIRAALLSHSNWGEEP